MPSPGSIEDRKRIDRAFRALRKRGIVALANVRGTRTDGWTEATEQAGDDETSCVFWTSEGARDVFRAGKLTRALHLQWRGDPVPIVNALRAEGLRVERPKSAKETIDVRGATGSIQGVLPEKRARVAAPRALSPLVQRVQAGLDAIVRAGWTVSWRPRLQMTDIDVLAPRSIAVATRSIANIDPDGIQMQLWLTDDPTEPIALLRKQRLKVKRETIQKRMAIVIYLYLSPPS